MADLALYERLRLAVEKLMAHPSFPEATTTSFADAVAGVRDTMADLEHVPMRRLIRPVITPPTFLHAELNDEEYGRSNVMLTLNRRGPERRGPGYQPGLKRRKTDV